MGKSQAYIDFVILFFFSFCPGGRNGGRFVFCLVPFVYQIGMISEDAV